MALTQEQIDIEVRRQVRLIVSALKTHGQSTQQALQDVRRTVNLLESELWEIEECNHG